MNSLELMREALKECKGKFEISNADLKRIYNRMFKLIVNEVKTTGKYTIVGFGTFKKGYVAGREGVCGLTKKPFKSEGREALKFKGSKKALK